MTYKELLSTISAFDEMFEKGVIHKEGLTVVYELDETNHFKLDEHLYYKRNPDGVNFTHSDIIEVGTDSGVMVKIIILEVEEKSK